MIHARRGAEGTVEVTLTPSSRHISVTLPWRMERMINVEDEKDEDVEGRSEDQQRRIVRLLIGSGMLRRRAARPMLLAQLLCERLEEEM